MMKEGGTGEKKKGKKILIMGAIREDQRTKPRKSPPLKSGVEEGGQGVGGEEMKAK